nr:NADP-dependent oxidoreductase [Acinetobacter sp. Marseille-Q1620]
MNQNIINRQVILKSRPDGIPQLDNFQLVQQQIDPLNDGEVLLKTIYLSLDPYMRGLMSQAMAETETWYTDRLELGDTIVGGTISRIVDSRHPDFQIGDLVSSFSGWQEYQVSDGTGLIKLDKNTEHLSHALSLIGMTGFTAYHGLLNIGQPKVNETVVVASATGAVGSVVGQIAKIKQAYTVGIAGGEEKCRYAVEVLGFDQCIDHKSPDFKQRLTEVLPNGIDVYFENVGGAVFEAVQPLLNNYARIPVCGVVAHYNANKLPEGPNRIPQLMIEIISKRLHIQGFLINDHYEQYYEQFKKDVNQWIAEGKLSIKEEIVDGIENAPQTFIHLLSGQNFGKVLIKVSEE